MKFIETEYIFINLISAYFSWISNVCTVICAVIQNIDKLMQSIMICVSDLLTQSCLRVKLHLCLLHIYLLLLWLIHCILRCINSLINCFIDSCRSDLCCYWTCCVWSEITNNVVSNICPSSSLNYSPNCIT